MLNITYDQETLNSSNFNFKKTKHKKNDFNNLVKPSTKSVKPEILLM